jgi:hypothetical protein
MAAAAYRQYKQTEQKQDKYDVGLKISTLLMKDLDYEAVAVRKKVMSDVQSILREAITSYAGLNKFHEIYSFYLIWTDSILDGQDFHISAKEWYKEYVLSLK